MIDYPKSYGTPPAWWGKGRAAAGKAAKDAKEASEDLRKAGKLRPIAPTVGKFGYGALFETVEVVDDAQAG